MFYLVIILVRSWRLRIYLGLTPSFAVGSGAAQGECPRCPQLQLFLVPGKTNVPSLLDVRGSMS